MVNAVYSMHPSGQASAPLPLRWPRLAVWLALALAALLAGCATALPKIDREAIASEAIEISTGTTLGRIAMISQPDPGLTGIRLMPLGTFSLDTRIQLARRAEATLDVQYYHIENDETGRWVLRALRDAAVRGVRVRLLIDDLYTGGSDWLFLGLAAHPNVEIRVFNPFCCARDQGQAGRFLASLNEFSRLNHRMHNKMFVADGAMAIIGGRNVANEYYLRNMSDNFIDVDAFVSGAALPAIAALFDRYWNNSSVYPFKAVAKSPLTDAQLRERFELETGPQKTPPPAPLPSNDVLGYGPLSDDLDLGRLGLHWGYTYVFADYPDKPFEEKKEDELLETSVTYNVLDVIERAQFEVVGSSPYFVPGRKGMGFLKGLRERGVQVSIMTNSLGSTDEQVVHTGYSRYREDMLKLGIDLYEISSTRARHNKHPFRFGASLGRLHAKLFVVDRKISFIGSMNLDPRSAATNTEFGAIVDSPEVAKELIRIINLDRLQSAYRVRLAADGTGLEWLTMDDSGEVILKTEPDTSPWVRFKSWLFSAFVPEELL